MNGIENIKNFHDRSRTFLEYIDEPAVAVTRDHTVVYFNSAFEKLFKSEWGKHLGARLEFIIPAFIASRINQHLQVLDTFTSPQTFFAEGRQKVYRITMAPVRGRGRIIGALITMADATAEREAKQINMALFRALIDDFGYPLAEMESACAMAPTRPEMAQTLLETTLSQLCQVQEKLQRFKELSEMLFGQLVPSWVVFQPMQLISLTLKTLHNAAKAREVTLEEATAEELPELMGDPALLNRVLALMVDYVIKSVPARELVVIATSLLIMPDSSYRLVLSITGTGWMKLHGFMPDKGDFIQELFQNQSEENRQPLFRLIMAQRLVQAMKGTITIAAHEQAGTTYSISIPTAVHTA